jgi:hypothetical protein
VLCAARCTALHTLSVASARARRATFDAPRRKGKRLLSTAKLCAGPGFTPPVRPIFFFTRDTKGKRGYFGWYICAQVQLYFTCSPFIFFTRATRNVRRR